MLGQQNNLANVRSVVGDLPVDGLHNGMGLASDRDGAARSAYVERLDGLEDQRPPLLPQL